MSTLLHLCCCPHEKCGSQEEPRAAAMGGFSSGSRVSAWRGRRTPWHGLSCCVLPTEGKCVCLESPAG